LDTYLVPEHTTLHLQTLLPAHLPLRGAKLVNQCAVSMTFLAVSEGVVVVNYIRSVLEDRAIFLPAIGSFVVVHDVGIVMEDWAIFLPAIRWFVVVNYIRVVVEDRSILLAPNTEALGRVELVVVMAGTFTKPAPVFGGDEGEEGDQKEDGE
jgi:hypothetical protein